MKRLVLSLLFIAANKPWLHAAAQEPSLIKQLAEVQLKTQCARCSICLENFTDLVDKHVFICPSIDDSGLTTRPHTVCRGCFMGLEYDNKGNVSCPECRRLWNPFGKLDDLMDAIRIGDVPSALEMIRNPLRDLNEQSEFGDTALIFAADRGRTNIVSVLVADQRTNINIQNNNKQTALLLATYHGHAAIVTALVAAGADANAQNRYGNTALMFAAYHGNEIIATQLLAIGGIALNKQDENGFTALMVAADKNQPAIVRKLLDAGADVNTQNRYGDTALIIAARNGFIDVVAMLLADPRTDVNAHDQWGKTALILAAQKGHHAIAAMIDKYIAAHPKAAAPAGDGRIAGPDAH